MLDVFRSLNLVPLRRMTTDGLNPLQNYVSATKSGNSLLGWLQPESSLWCVCLNEYAPETNSVYTGSVDGQLVERVGQGSERTRENFTGDKADSEDTRETAGAVSRYFI